MDVACGAAPVACAVAAALPSAEVWGLDIDPAAVALSRANARRNRLANARFRVSDLLAGLPARLRGEVGAFTMHPPYVARREVRALPREIRGFEPRHTLTDGSADGLGLVRDLVEQAPGWLRRGGVVLFEVAPYLSRPVQSLLRGAELEVSVRSDPGGLTRVVGGRRSLTSAVEVDARRAQRLGAGGERGRPPQPRGRDRRWRPRRPDLAPAVA